MCKRQDAAHVSLPSALRLATSADSAAAAAAVGALGSPVCLGGLAPLAEDADDGEEAAGEQQAQPQPEQGEQQPQEQWVWRTALEATEPFWAGWYTGLSDAFLALPVPKVGLVSCGCCRCCWTGGAWARSSPADVPPAGNPCGCTYHASALPSAVLPASWCRP